MVWLGTFQNFSYPRTGIPYRNNPSKNKNDDINIYYYLDGLGLGGSLIIIGLYFTLKYIEILFN